MTRSNCGCFHYDMLQVVKYVYVRIWCFYTMEGFMQKKVFINDLCRCVWATVIQIVHTTMLVTRMIMFVISKCRECLGYNTGDENQHLKLHRKIVTRNNCRYKYNLFASLLFCVGLLCYVMKSQ